MDALLTEIVGRRDDATLVRDVLRKELLMAVEAALAAQAIELHLAIELSPGVALPLSLAVSLPRLPDSGFGDAELDPIETFLSRSVDDGGRPGSPATGADAALRVVRQTYRRSHRPAGLDRDLPVLQADYWAAAKDPDRLALLSFTTVLVDLEPLMLELFDAVVGTLRWP